MQFLKKNWIALLILVLVGYFVGSEKYEDYRRHKRLNPRGGTTAGSVLLGADTLQKLSSGMSMECLRESRKSDWTATEIKIQADQERLAALGVLTPLVATSGPLGQQDRLVTTKRAQPREFPTPTVDVLANTGITLENQFDDHWGMTDEAIRGMADQAYQKNGILDESLRGWTLSVRPSQQGSNTFLDEERKVAIVNLQGGDELFSGPHELAHVLSGPAFLNNKDVPHVAKEFVAIAAEAVGPEGLRVAWSYSLQNVPILGMGKSINGESGVIHAMNAPLDGWRYDVLRLTDEVIGEEGQVSLAKALWEQASRDNGITMSQIQVLFEEAGIRDLAIFTQTLEPGLYLDMTFTRTGMPVILAKTIDADGYEGLTQVPTQLVWRDQEGAAMASGEPFPLQPAMMLEGMGLFAQYASALELRVAGEVYTFRLQSPIQGVTTTTKVVHSVTKEQIH